MQLRLFCGVPWKTRWKTILAPLMGSSPAAVMAKAIADPEEMGYTAFYNLMLDNVRTYCPGGCKFWAPAFSGLTQSLDVWLTSQRCVCGYMKNYCKQLERSLLVHASHRAAGDWIATI
jgi:hypothetical protein